MDTPHAPAGWSPPAVRWDEHVGSAGLDILDAAAPLLSLAASWRLWSSLGAEGAPRRAGVMGGWAQGRSRASGEGERGTSVWAGVRGVGPGPRGRVAPPGSGSGAGLSQKTPVAVDR